MEKGKNPVSKDIINCAQESQKWKHIVSQKKFFIFCFDNNNKSRNIYLEIENICSNKNELFRLRCYIRKIML